MAKLNFNGVNFKEMKSKESANKIARNTVAFVNEKGVCLVTNGSDIAEVYQEENSVDSTLEGFVSFMQDMVPVDTLLEKPFRVILPKSISGLVTGAYIDWVRTGKTVSTGAEISSDKMALYKKVITMINERFANMEVIADRYANKADKEVVNNAWNSLRAIVKDMLSGKIVCKATENAKPALSEKDMARIEKLKADRDALEDELLLADDPEEEARLERKIAKYVSAITRVYTSAGVSAPVSEMATEESAPVVETAVKGGVEF